jgi:DNA-binding transcriptional ArsR family regulator
MQKPIKPYTQDQEKLARYAKALGHPARVFILRFLDKQSACYAGNIVDELPMAQSSVSQHLRELKDAGLIQGSVETPKVKYCINKQTWGEAQKMFESFFRRRSKNNCI